MVSFTDKLSAFNAVWNGGGEFRLYFDNLDVLYGLDIVSDESGYALSATLDGVEIEVYKALYLRARLSIAVIWFDFRTSSFGFVDIDPAMANKIIEEIKNFIEEERNNAE